MDKLKLEFLNIKKEIYPLQKTENGSSDSKRIKTFQEWMYSIKLQTRKGLYKMAYADISRNACYYTSFEEGIEINIIQITIMFKIIKRKQSKYTIDNSSPNQCLVYSIRKWLNKIEACLDLLFFNLSSKVDLNCKQYSSVLESLVHFYIEYLYINALFYRQINRIEKTCAYIGISILVIQRAISRITKAKTLNIIEKIYLLAVNILMNNQDYFTALEYQEKVIDYSFRELIIKIDYFQGIQDCIKEKKKNRAYASIFQNISVAFCLRGICKESVGSITKSIEAYKQSKWFANKFLNESNPFYCKLLVSLVNRSIIYHNVISSLTEAQGSDQRMLDVDDKATSNGDITKSLIANGHYMYFKKYRKTEEIIFNLKGADVEAETQFSNKESHGRNRSDRLARSNSDMMLSNIRLLDAYSSSEFKDNLYEMKKINIGNIDLETRESLQKVMDKLKAQKDRQCESKASSTKNLTLFNQKAQTASQRSIHCSQKQKELFLISDHSSKRAHKPRNTNSRKLEKERFANARKFFSKAFTTKKNYIERLNNRELTFHKNLLSLKTNEKYPPLAKNEVTIEMKAFQTFNRLKDNASRNKKILLQADLTNKEKRDQQSQKILERTVLKSLNSRKFDELNSIREMNRRSNSMKTLTSGINDNDVVVYKERNEIDEKNKQTLRKISLDLCTFASHSKTSQENHCKSKRNASLSISSQFNIIKKSKREFNLEQFITTQHKERLFKNETNY